jgi:hypothetical protein
MICRVQPLSFLSAMPALLGLAGFVLYQMLGANKSGDTISQRIIDKLRAIAPDEVPSDQRLDARQVERLLKSHYRLQEIVGKQDFDLLHQALSQQFIITLVAYILPLCFCGWSVYLYVHNNLKIPTDSGPAPPVIIQQSGPGGANVVSSGTGSVSVQQGASTTKGTAPETVVGEASRTKAAGSRTEANYGGTKK